MVYNIYYKPYTLVNIYVSNKTLKHILFISITNKYGSRMYVNHSLIAVSHVAKGNFSLSQNILVDFCL